MKLVAGGNSLTMLRAGFEYPCGKPPPWHELRPPTPQVPRYAKRELKLASLILVSHIHQGSIKKHLPGRRLLEVPTGLAFMRCLCIGDLYSHAQLSQRSKKKKDIKDWRTPVQGFPLTSDAGESPGGGRCRRDPPSGSAKCVGLGHFWLCRPKEEANLPEEKRGEIDPQHWIRLKWWSMHRENWCVRTAV